MTIEWEVKTIKLGDLKPYERNPRRMKKYAFDKLKQNIERDGYRNPIVVDTDLTMIGGHHRLKALKAIGYKSKDEIKVLMPNRKLTEEEFKRNNLTDNIDYGEFDYDMLANEFDIMELQDYGLPTDFFTDDDLILANAEDDDPIEVPKEAITKPGDLYLLGNHRLLCGDSTNALDVEKLLDRNKIDFIYADPPYGIDLALTYTKGSGRVVAERVSYDKFQNDTTTQVAKDCFNLLVAMDCSIVYWGANYFTDFLPPSKCWLAWYKKEDLPADSFCDTELAYTNIAKHCKTFSVQWKGIIKEGEQGVKRVHPTQKPIKLALEVFIYLKAGHTIYDPFGGSGTTLIACEKSGRNCYMMEIDPKYCDVIVARWEKLTGNKAKLLEEQC